MKENVDHLVAVIVLLLVSVAVWTFSFSLAPFHNERELTDGIPTATVSVISSSLCWVISLAVVIEARRREAMSRPLSRVLAVFIVVSFGTAFIVADRGYTLGSHGAFNLLGLSIFTAVAAVVHGTLVVTSRILGTWRRSFAFWGSVIAVIGVSRVFVLARAHRTWTDGILGRTMQPSQVCRIPVPRVVWESIWPRHVVRVWTDSACPKSETHRGLATISSDGKLWVECDNRTPATAMAYPRLEWAGIEWGKLEAKEFPRAVMTRNTTLRVEAGKPVDVKWTYAVEATCGRKRELLVNVARNETAAAIAKRNAETSGKRDLPPVDVLLMLLDTVSRKAVERLMTKTIAEFVSKGSDPRSSHEVFQFFRYNALCSYSGPNYEALWANPNRKEFSFFTEARRHGFVSALIFGQCEAQFKWGKSSNPDLWPIGVFCHREYQPEDVDSYLTQGPYSPRRRCILGRRVHEYSMELLRKFWGAYGDIPKLGLWVAMEGHEYTTNVIAQLDGDLSEVVSGRAMEINNTIIFIFSDHGSHSSIGFFLRQSVFFTPPSLFSHAHISHPQNSQSILWMHENKGELCCREQTPGIVRARSKAHHSIVSRNWRVVESQRTNADHCQRYSGNDFTSSRREMASVILNSTRQISHLRQDQ